MSVQSTAPLSPDLFTASSASGTRNKLSVAGLSLNGILLFVTSLLVVASGLSSLRPVVAGLALHPYLVPVALAFPLVFMSRGQEFPIRVLVALVIFTGMFFFSAASGATRGLGEVFKLGTSVVVIVTCALLVRRRGDFVAGALGLSIAVALLAVRGLQSDSVEGVQAIQGANKNSYSLFALPAMLLSGYIVLHFKTLPVVVKGLFVGCTIPALAAIFMSGNRSGYVGAVLVGLMLFWDRRGKGLLLVGAIAAIVAFWIVQFGSTKVLDERLKQTVQGTESDNLRRELLVICLDIGLENPLVGVSPQTLPFEIGRRIGAKQHVRVLEPHNVFAYIFAGSGLICFTALAAVAWTLWSLKPRRGGPIGDKGDPFREARRLMRMFIILWVTRGIFTAEILYNPATLVAAGLIIGLCLLAEVARGAQPATSSLVSTRPGPGHVATSC